MITLCIRSVPLIRLNSSGNNRNKLGAIIRKTNHISRCFSGAARTYLELFKGKAGAVRRGGRRGQHSMKLFCVGENGINFQHF